MRKLTAKGINQILNPAASYDGEPETEECNDRDIERQLAWSKATLYLIRKHLDVTYSPRELKRFISGHVFCPSAGCNGRVAFDYHGHVNGHIHAGCNGCDNHFRTG